MYRLKYKRRARNFLARLPTRNKSAIVDKLHELSQNPENGSLDVYPLKGREGFRLRVGQYRIIYTKQEHQLIIEIVEIRPRGDVYKG